MAVASEVRMSESGYNDGKDSNAPGNLFSTLLDSAVSALGIPKRDITKGKTNRKTLLVIKLLIP